MHQVTFQSRVFPHKHEQQTHEHHSKFVVYLSHARHQIIHIPCAFSMELKKMTEKNPTNKHEQQPKIIHASSNKTIERRLCFDSDHIYSHKCMLLMCYERQLLSQRHSIGCILFTFVNSIHQHN